jgi:hypothetical protein
MHKFTLKMGFSYIVYMVTFAVILGFNVYLFAEFVGSGKLAAVIVVLFVFLVNYIVERVILRVFARSEADR